MPQITRYEDMEKQMIAAQKQDIPPAIKCRKCGSTYLKIETYAQYQANFTVTLGMEPPVVPDTPICHILKCVCGELYEVKANRLANNRLNKMYDGFLDIVEKVSRE